jgi:hypothetical protein
MNGVFNNTAAPPALVFFHYRAGTYEVMIDNPTDFGQFSDIRITFTTINAIDINILAPAHFPPLAGGSVSFHADFNAFTTAPVLSSDSLPTNTGLSAASFDESAVTLIRSPSGVVTSSVVTSLTLTAAADFDEDGDVDGDDLAGWQDGFGDGNAHSDGDADRDGDVDGGDFLVWQQQRGIARPAVTPAPEPNALMLLVMALAIFSAAGTRLASAPARAAKRQDLDSEAVHSPKA